MNILGPFELNKFEKEVLEFMLKRDAPECLPHLDLLAVSKRKYTGHGIYVDMIYKQEPKITIKAQRLIAFINLQGVVCGGGLALYMTDGKIDFLEAFCNGIEGDWPRDINEFTFYDE